MGPGYQDQFRPRRRARRSRASTCRADDRTFARAVHSRHGDFVHARLRNRISPVSTLPGYRPRRCLGADVDGHDDAAAGRGVAAVQVDLLRACRRLEPRGRQLGAELRTVTTSRSAGGKVSKGASQISVNGEAPRAWQRMLSGRRLDLLDPSPLDIEIEDIAHGLARVARWNGQTHGDYIFSVAQHTF